MTQETEDELPVVRINLRPDRGVPIRCPHCGAPVSLPKNTVESAAAAVSSSRTEKRYRLSCDNKKCKKEAVIVIYGGLRGWLRQNGVGTFLLAILAALACVGYWHFALGIALVLFGLLFLHGAWGIVRMGIKSRTWIPVDATILTSEIITTTGRRKDGSTFHKAASIWYGYHLDGVDFQSNQVSFSDLGKRARSIVAKYPRGRRITAYVNPADHRQAFLENGMNYTGIVFYMFLGLPLMGVGAYLLTERMKWILFLISTQK